MLQGCALTWWNTLVQIRGRAAAIAQPWEDFKKWLKEEYFPNDEIQKLESEFWNHKMVGSDIDGYTARFHELARLVPHMVTPENQRVNRYIRGLALEIKAHVTSSKPTTIQSVSRFRKSNESTLKFEENVPKEPETVRDQESERSRNSNTIPVVREIPLRISGIFIEGLPHLAEESFAHRIYFWSYACCKITLSFGTTEMQELSNQLKELQDKGFIRPSFFTLGSTGVVREKEGWFVPHVYRLSRAEQANYQEPDNPLLGFDNCCRAQFARVARVERTGEKERETLLITMTGNLHNNMNYLKGYHLCRYARHDTRF
ncbi:putative reverse transcriptase domain-containing protein [Tanacetum coccineum]